MTDALAGLSPERAREIVRRFASMVVFAPDAETAKMVKGYIGQTMSKEDAVQVATLAERGLATLGATEAFAYMKFRPTDYDALGTIWRSTVEKGVVGRRERRVLILREGA